MYVCEYAYVFACVNMYVCLYACMNECMSIMFAKKINQKEDYDVTPCCARKQTSLNLLHVKG